MAVSEPPESSVPYRGQVFCSGLVFCSVCLEAVVDKGERSIAKLKCGHCFHLDCIGSAFNAKGAMQCPNCRQVEQGQWLFPNGCLPEDLAEDLTLETNYEMYTGISNIVHHEDEMFGHMPWCPFQGSHPHFSVSIEERNDLASRYPNTVANVRHHMRSAHPGINCPYLALETHPSTTAAPLPYDRSLWPHHPSITSSASSSTSALSDATTHGFPSIDRIAFLQAGAHPQTGGWLFQNPLFIHPGVQRRPNGVAIVPSGAGHHQSHGFGVNGSGAFLQPPLAVNPSHNNSNNNSNNSNNSNSNSNSSNNNNNNNNNNNGVVGRRARSWGSVSSSAHSQRMMSQMDWHGSENEVESWIRGQAYAPRGPFGIHHWLTWVPPGRNS